MITVKISTPEWNDFGFENHGLSTFTPGLSRNWGKYNFEINNSCTTCDYWIIVEDVSVIEKVQVPVGNTILITTEEITSKFYNSEYLKQFEKIITSRADINGNHVIKTYYLQGWFIKKSFDFLNGLITLPKHKCLSVISSDLTHLDGHKQRFAFVNKLIGHFKDKIDAYGRGFNQIQDKWDALAPYKYSVAIENSSIKNYFTEKIRDCYLCHTMPIYYGCPNVDDFFSSESYISIDIQDFKKSIQTIERAIDENFYEKALSSIILSKSKVLFEHQFFPHLTSILDTLEISQKRHNISVYPENYRPTKKWKQSLLGRIRNMGKIAK